MTTASRGEVTLLVDASLRPKARVSLPACAPTRELGTRAVVVLAASALGTLGSEPAVACSMGRLRTSPARSSTFAACWARSAALSSSSDHTAATRIRADGSGAMATGVGGVRAVAGTESGTAATAGRASRSIPARRPFKNCSTRVLPSARETYVHSSRNPSGEREREMLCGRPHRARLRMTVSDMPRTRPPSRPGRKMSFARSGAGGGGARPFLSASLVATPALALPSVAATGALAGIECGSEICVASQGALWYCNAPSTKHLCIDCAAAAGQGAMLQTRMTSNDLAS